MREKQWFGNISTDKVFVYRDILPYGHDISCPYKGGFAILLIRRDTACCVLFVSTFVPGAGVFTVNGPARGIGINIFADKVYFLRIPDNVFVKPALPKTAARSIT